MRLLKPSSEQAKLGLRAFRTLFLADPELNTLTDLQIQALEASQKLITHTNFPLEELEKPVTAEELSAGYAEPALREQLVEGMVIMSVVNGTPKKEQVEQIKHWAAALEVNEELINSLHLLVNKHKILYSFDVMRHMYIGEAIAKIWHEEKFKGLINTIRAIKGFSVDPELEKRFEQLGELPPNTLGKAFWQFYKDHQFTFPGAKYGSPMMITYHDMAHVLGGYSTIPAGELQVASFTAGFRKVGRAWILLFIISQFHLGVSTTPIDVPIAVGQFNPDEELMAMQRGTLMNVDLFDNWDYWAVVHRDLDELRREYNIVSKEEAYQQLKE